MVFVFFLFFYAESFFILFLCFILGEFSREIEDAPYLLEGLVSRFAEECPTVRLELLTAAVKCFFTSPGEMQHILGSLLQQAIGDASHPDIRDRALFYYRFLKSHLKEAKQIICTPLPPVEEIELMGEFNTLSVMYSSPSSSFLYVSPPIPFGGRRVSSEGDETEQSPQLDPPSLPYQDHNDHHRKMTMEKKKKEEEDEEEEDEESTKSRYEEEEKDEEYSKRSGGKEGRSRTTRMNGTSSSSYPSHFLHEERKKKEEAEVHDDEKDQRQACMRLKASVQMTSEEFQEIWQHIQEEKEERGGSNEDEEEERRERVYETSFVFLLRDFPRGLGLARQDLTRFDEEFEAYAATKSHLFTMASGVLGEKKNGGDSEPILKLFLYGQDTHDVFYLCEMRLSFHEEERETKAAVDLIIKAILKKEEEEARHLVNEKPYNWRRETNPSSSSSRRVLTRKCLLEFAGEVKRAFVNLLLSHEGKEKDRIDQDEDHESRACMH
ncbi:heat repeat-containing protein [Cystoisospora suis]|uniref:Heat repeat-containing protein n=1 Tax=Cystoisospora suis TaxID=483139 RepID=A0A2C6KUU9_9APIC|nr:heat repeat-containing protein [Cystoisospora suis]